MPKKRCIFISHSGLVIDSSFDIFCFSWAPPVVALIGMIFWGIGMSAQGSLFQAMLTGIIPPQKRSTAFGLFDTGYGIAWFVGSAVMGLLYEKSVLAVALFSVSLQLAAIPIFFIANKMRG